MICNTRYVKYKREKNKGLFVLQISFFKKSTNFVYIVIRDPILFQFI
jgi:hypothetical protein